MTPRLAFLALAFAAAAFSQVSAIPSASGGGGATIPSVTNLIKGDGAGNGADSGIAATAVATLTGTQTLTNKTVDGVTPTVFGYLDPTSSVQTQINGKLATAGTAADSSKVGGIAVTGTPSTGQVPTATGSTAATWQTPAGGTPAGATGAVQFNNAGALGGVGVTSSQIAVPASPTLTVHCTAAGGETCSTTYQYSIAALSHSGFAVSAYAATVTNGPDTLTDVPTGNYISIAAPVVSGAASCLAVRGLLGAGDPNSGNYGPGGLLDSFSGPYKTFACGTTFDDTGYSGDYANAFLQPTWMWVAGNSSMGLSLPGALTSCADIQCGGAGEAFGFGAIASGLRSLASGIGSVASGVKATAIGYTSVASGNYSVALGAAATATGVDSFAVGESPFAGGDYSDAIGNNAFATADHSIAIGYDSKTTAPNTLVIGGRSDGGNNISEWFMGRDSGGPISNVIHAQGVAGTDVAGSDITIAGGQSTGVAAGGILHLSTSPTGSTGATKNALVDAITIAADGTIKLLTVAPATTGVRFICIDTTGKLVSQAAACVGT